LTVKTTAEVAKMKAHELDAQFKVSAKFAEVGKKANALDEKFHVSQKASHVAHATKSAAENVAKKAMENKHVSAGVAKLGGMFSSLLSVANQTMEETKKEIKVEKEAKKLKSPRSQEPLAAIPAVEVMPPTSPGPPPAPIGNRTTL
jgi:hypothetical protein